MKYIYNRFIKYIIPALLVWFIVSCQDDEMGTDNSALVAKISETENFVQGKEEGTGLGDYLFGSVTALKNKIEWAKMIKDRVDNQHALDNAVLILDKGMEIVENSVIRAAYPMQFVGQSSIRCGSHDLYNPVDEFTVEFRVKLNSFNSQIIVANIIGTDFQDSAGPGGWAIRSYSNGNGDKQIDYVLGLGGGGWYVDVLPDVLELNKWTHLAVTYNWTTKSAKVYKDGILLSNKSISHPINANSELSKLNIGGNEFWGDRRDIDGQVIDVRIWGRELSADEINERKDDFLSNAGQYSGLNAYWPLNLALGSEILDETGQHTAILSGIEWVDPN